MIKTHQLIRFHASLFPTSISSPLIKAFDEHAKEVTIHQQLFTPGSTKLHLRRLADSQANLLFRHLTPSPQHLVAESTYEHRASSPAEPYQHSPIRSAPFHQPLGRKTRLRFVDSWQIQLCRRTQPGGPIEGALLTEDSLLRSASPASY